MQVVAQAASARPYSLGTNLISDLGNTSCGPVTCSPLHGLVDATFVVVGLMHWFGAAGLWRAWPPSRMSRPGLVCIALAGWSLAYAGVFPEDVAPAQHRFGATLGLVSLNLGMIVLGSVLVRRERVLGGLAIGAGAIGLVSFVALLTPALGLPAGAVERLADYPGAAMLVVLGAALLVRLKSAASLHSPRSEGTGQGEARAGSGSPGGS